jgi:hypothetical protein
MSEEEPIYTKQYMEKLIANCARFLVDDEQLPLTRKQEFIEKAKSLFKDRATESEFNYKVNQLYLEDFVQ